MNERIAGLLAETYIHSGTGRTEGAIDLPAAREAATDFPFLPGSSFKGALRDFARRSGLSEGVIDSCFGVSDNAGGLLVSDVRLLLLPVRSLQGAYKWVTCPQILERYRRDMERAGLSVEGLKTPKSPEKGKVLGKGEENLFLEELNFSFAKGLPEGLVGRIGELIRHEETRKRLDEQMVILHDDDFSWFARYGLAVQTRNVLDPETKESKNLWSEESLPPDTLMYCLLGERNNENSLQAIAQLANKTPYIQTGGNETVGQGWFAMHMQPVRGGKDESE